MALRTIEDVYRRKTPSCWKRVSWKQDVKDVPRLPKFRKKPVAYAEAELKKFFGVCDDWERAFLALALATGLRRGELQTLHWSDLDLAHRQVHVTAKPEYGFLPKDWEERTVAIPKQVAEIFYKHPRLPGCPIVFPSPNGKLNYRFVHERCKEVAKRAGLDPKEWRLHRFRSTSARGSRCSPAQLPLDLLLRLQDGGVRWPSLARRSVSRALRLS